MLKKLLLSVVVVFASIGMAIAAVNINTATEQELESLPGVGPAKAKAIVEYRKAHGNFKAAEDLKNVKGIGDKTFNDLKSKVAVSGPTSVDATPAQEKKAGAKEAKAETKAAAKEVKADAQAATSAAKGEAKSAAAAVGDKADKAAKKTKSAASSAEKAMK